MRTTLARFVVSVCGRKDTPAMQTADTFVGPSRKDVRFNRRAALNARATVETFDGALLYAIFSGFLDLGIL